MELLIVLVVLGFAVLLIVGPLRGGDGSTDPRAQSADRAELEAAKEAKYREVRDAELDYRTGKLSRQDWERLDSALRAEAVELLRRLDALEAREQSRTKAAPEGVDSDSGS